MLLEGGLSSVVFTPRANAEEEMSAGKRDCIQRVLANNKDMESTRAGIQNCFAATESGQKRDRVIFSNGAEKWDDLSVKMVIGIIKQMPRSPFERVGAEPFRVELTNDPLPNDVEIATDGTIRFSRSAFAHSVPTLKQSKEDNASGLFYSNRLYRAVLKAFYNDYDSLKEVIQKRYGFEVGLGEPADEFQKFSPEELQYVASTIEDLPSGFWKTRGLDKIVRRKQGLTNPKQPDKCALAHVGERFIEFMDCAFSSRSPESIQRTVTHELGHFIWRNILTDKSREKFASLSGWILTKNDTWVRDTTQNFVSAYAASENPDEDFCETISYYVYNPDLVRNLAPEFVEAMKRLPEKYKFIKEIMGGYEYYTFAAKKFTFQVLDSRPDTTFPGKIIGIDTTVSKTPDGDNHVIADIHLSPKNGDGASEAFARIVSPVDTYVDQYFFPVNGNRFLLRAEFILSKYAAKGNWAPKQITVKDQVDNRRYEGQNQFKWQMVIDNPEEDLEAPTADVEHIQSKLVSLNGENMVRITVPVSDAHEEGLRGYGILNQYESGQEIHQYAEYDKTTKSLVWLFPVRKYNASGKWTFREFETSDIAKNWRRIDLREKSVDVDVKTLNPDSQKPSLDVSSVHIEAAPVHPKDPDGETDVTIQFKAWDDSSGLGTVAYRIQSPDGKTLFDYFYHSNFHTPYFVGDPSESKPYKIQLRLPPGSAPGTWILRELILHDKAGNVLSTNFVEIGILKPAPKIIIQNAR